MKTINPIHTDWKKIDEAAYAFKVSLLPEELAYCRADERGEHKGFAALHDLFDANQKLNVITDSLWPELGWGNLEQRFEFYNNVTGRFNELYI